jgi:hypothetical protein
MARGPVAHVATHYFYLFIYLYKETRALRVLCLLGCLSQLEEVQP